MPEPIQSSIDCHWVGEFVDEAEIPAGLVIGQSETVKAHTAATCVDLWGADGDLREFTALFHDGTIAMVQGHRLLHERSPNSGEDLFCIVTGSGRNESLVAAFKSKELQGIFQGELRLDRKIA